MEIVAMDMKLRGIYIARQLSFHGVTFNIDEIQLSPEFVRAYNDSVALVSKLLFGNPTVKFGLVSSKYYSSL